MAADFARWPSPIPFVLRFKCGSVEAPNPWKTRGARRPAECDGISKCGPFAATICCPSKSCSGARLTPAAAYVFHSDRRKGGPGSLLIMVHGDGWPATVRNSQYRSPWPAAPAYRQKSASNKMIGKGIPSSQSNIPRPNPMVLFLVSRGLLRAGQRANSTSRMIIGIGMPSSQSRIGIASSPLPRARDETAFLPRAVSELTTFDRG